MARTLKGSQHKETAMKWWKQILSAILVLVLAPVIFAEALSPTNGGSGQPVFSGWGYGQPGDYHLAWFDPQQVMATYEIHGVPVELRGNIARLFKSLLKGDGRGGNAEVAPIEGKDSFFLTIVATPMMQESIARTVEKINSERVGVYNYLPKTVVYVPRFRAAQSIAAALRPELTNIGMVYVDEVLNALTIEDDPTYVDFLVWVAEQFDRIPPSANARVTIVEILESDDERIGLDWNAWLDTLPVSISGGISAARLPLAGSRSLSLGTGDLNLGLSRGQESLSSLGITSLAGAVEGISPQALAGFLNFLSSKGKARMETTVDIVVMNGVSSVVSTETSVAVPATVDNEVGGKIRTEALVLEGVNVSIRGVLFEKGQRLDVEASCVSVVGESRNGTPIVSTSRLSTSAGFAPGATVVLSGLTREKDQEVIHGPDWDVLRLLSKKVTVRTKSRVYICITTRSDVDPSK